MNFPLKNSIIIFLIIAAILIGTDKSSAQQKISDAPNFESIVENRLKTAYNTNLEKICPVKTDAAARRIFSEYGAIFVSNGAFLPGKCIFSNEAEVASFQLKSNPQTATVDNIEIVLQKQAMEAFLKAREAAAKKKLKISPRGGSLAAGRSFDDTVKLWNSRFSPALSYWVAQKKIPAADAAAARTLPIPEQIAEVLEWEKSGFFFSKDLSKSILYSVAAPGASQHNFLLALDVEQFANKDVRKILAENGWFQTVKSDLPHFTYLGVKESELPAFGLKSVAVGNQIFWIPNL